MESKPDARRELVAALEGAFYTGSTAGQIWLSDLSAYIQRLPDDDARLVALAAHTQPAPVGEFLALEPHPVVSQLNPCSWLDDYTTWATD